VDGVATTQHIRLFLKWHKYFHPAKLTLILPTPFDCMLATFLLL
jgi:hypothetical protein